MKVSIITVTYNAASTLPDTLHSVARQTLPGVEHILVDGGSKDDTLAIARDVGAHLATVVSERDRGLYDAMNKGVRLSSGDVVGFLNADDWYADAEVLRSVAEAFEAGADIVYGDLVLIDPHPPHTVKRIWRDRLHQADDFFRSGWQPAHPTTFVRRSVFDAAGGFDLRWRISADYAFLAHAMRLPGVRLAYVARTLVNMRVGGLSTAGAHAVWRANRECFLALREIDAPAPSVTIAAKLARKVPQVLKARLAAGTQAVAWRPWVE
jgi:glycosyltransferase involved in cell wall biosynthesis